METGREQSMAGNELVAECDTCNNTRGPRNNQVLLYMHIPQLRITPESLALLLPSDTRCTGYARLTETENVCLEYLDLPTASDRTHAQSGKCAGGSGK
jgi:hypothetical protein